MAGQLTGNVGCVLPTLDLNEAEMGDPALSGTISLPHGPLVYIQAAQPFSLLSAAPCPCLPSPPLCTLESGPTFLPPRPATHLSPSVSHCSTAPSHPEPSVYRCLRGAAATGTFWATWLTQGEVQLLRSGPRGFQSPRAGRHWKEAIPAGTDRQDREGSHKEGEKGPKQGERR